MRRVDAKIDKKGLKSLFWPKVRTFAMYFGVKSIKKYQIYSCLIISKFPIHSEIFAHVLDYLFKNDPFKITI